MGGLLAAVVLFAIGYLINIFYITVLYHRGLSHGSVVLGPKLMALLKWTGIWVTGIDPKAWACMHRMHHMHSDTELDPHSPKIFGIFGVAVEQLHSYENVLRQLIKKNPAYTRLVSDIPFSVSTLNYKRLWMLPYILHLLIGVGIGFGTGSIVLGVAYYVGIMSHPVQGWMVNALAHKYGYRNFSTKDESTNNWMVSLLVFGEGYQNNHHARPKRANFAIRSTEFDFGYALCLLSKKLGLLSLPG